MIKNKSAFTGKDYLAASRERIADVDKLASSDNIVGAIYFAGTAVESVFRAYMTLHTKEFDDKHNLVNLFESSQFGQKLNEEEKKVFALHLKSVAIFWNNNLRYASGLRLKRTLCHQLVKEGRKVKNIHNYLMRQYEPLLEASKQIVKKGTEKWN